MRISLKLNPTEVLCMHLNKCAADMFVLNNAQKDIEGAFSYLISDLKQSNE